MIYTCGQKTLGEEPRPGHRIAMVFVGVGVVIVVVLEGVVLLRVPVLVLVHVVLLVLFICSTQLLVLRTLYVVVIG